MASKKFELNGTKQAILEKLAELKIIDVKTTWRRGKWGWVAGLSLILFFLFLAIAVPVFHADTDDKSGFVFVVIFLFLTFIGFVNYIRNKSKDLDDRKLDTATKMVQCVGEDIPPSSECQLVLDFSDYRKGGTIVSQNKKFLGPKEYVYNHKWLTFAGKLFDGNKFELEVEQDVKRKEVPKRKYTKVKENITETASLKVKFNPEFYPEPTRVAENINRGSSPYGMDVKGVLGTDKSLKVTMCTSPARFLTGRTGTQGDYNVLINADKLLGLFMLTYDAIRNTRRAA